MSTASSVEQKTGQKLKGQLAVLATAVLWSTGGVFIKLLNWHPVVISSIRSLIAAVFMLIIRFIIPPPKGVKNPAFPFWGSAVFYCFTMLAFVIANKLTASANAIMLQYSAPVWTALLGWRLLKEKPHWEHWGALIMVAAGLLLFFRGAYGSGAFLGDMIALLSGIFFAANSVFMRMMKDNNPQDAMLMAHVLNAAICVPFIFLYPPAPSATDVLAILCLGIIQVGLASALFSYGIKRISAIQAMLTSTLEPILNPVWVLIIIGEIPSPAALAGGIIIIIAVLSSSLIGKYRDDREAKSLGIVGND